jgi:hypothetical protein
MRCRSWSAAALAPLRRLPRGTLVGRLCRAIRWSLSMRLDGLSACEPHGSPKPLSAGSSVNSEFQRNH